MARIITFFVGLFAAILLPTAILFGAALLSPPPYILTRDLPDAWFQGITPPDGYRLNAPALGHAIFYRFDSPSQARDWTATRLPRLGPSSYVKSYDGVARFHFRNSDKAGVIFPVGNYSVEIIGNDDKAVHAMEAALPYIKKNPAPSLDSFLQEHWPALIAGILAYMVLVGLAMNRAASWATTVRPPKGTVPAPQSTLKRLLLDVNHADLPFSLTETGKDRMTAEWLLADARWNHIMQQKSLKRVERVILDFDERAHVVRVLERSRTIATSWSPWALFASLAFFQGIRFKTIDIEMESGVGFDLKRGWHYDPGYQYRFDPDEMKAPLAAAVLQSGWTWKPVVFLSRPLGG